MRFLRHLGLLLAVVAALPSIACSSDPTADSNTNTNTSAGDADADAGDDASRVGCPTFAANSAGCPPTFDALMYEGTACPTEGLRCDYPFSYAEECDRGFQCEPINTSDGGQIQGWVVLLP